MKNYFFTFILFFQIFAVFSQDQLKLTNNIERSVEESQLLMMSKLQNYIYTYSGAIITGNITDVNSADKIPYISIDSLKINLSDIKFLKLGDDFWANTYKVNKTNSFALRNFEGSLSTYTKVETSKQNYYISSFISGGRVRSNYTEISTDQNYDYYNTGVGDLKPVKYDYLINDVEDNYNSNQLLKKSKKYKNFKIGFVGASIISVITGVVLKNDNIVSKSTHFLLGAGLGWAGVGMRKKQEKLLLDAIEAYDK